MVRNKHIKTRNLIVTETFDEFARAVEALDFTVEDIVGYVTSVSRNFYWLNTESVWGVLGFTWDNQTDVSNEEALTHPNPLYRLTQVTPEGGKIEMDQDWLIEHKVKKGYGHFNATTLPFTVIPVLPDGYRITEFNNTFKDIASSYIEVLKSDWSNLTRIHNLVPRGKSIKVDVTGANLSSTNDTAIILSSNATNLQSTWKSTVYIKGDLENCTAGIFEGYATNNWTAGHTILLDDNNKELKLPVSLLIQNQFYYRDSDKTFDVREWLSLNEPVSRNNTEIRLLADSGKYYIDNAFARQIQDAGSIFAISPVASNLGTVDSFENGINLIDNPISQNITPCTITIDCTENGDVRENKLFTPRDMSYGGTGVGTVKYETRLHCFNPIIYKGEVNSIAMWNPFCLVKDDNSWPVYDQSMIDKLVPEVGGYIMPYSYVYITKPSGYTIDCSNLKVINLFRNSFFYISDYSNLRHIGRDVYTAAIYAMEVVKLINVNTDTFAIRTNAGEYFPRAFYDTLPTLETVSILDNRSPHFFIPADSVITFNHWYSFGYTNFQVEDFTKIHFKFKYIDGRNHQGATRSFAFKNSLYFKPGYGITEVGTSTGPINMYEFDEQILNDTEYLKAASINTFESCMKGREVIHPFICVDPPYSHVYYAGVTPHISSNFIFIYKANITFKNYVKWADITNILDVFLTKIVPNIQPNDTADTYYILLSENIFNALYEEHSDVVNYIINSLNYELRCTNE